MRRQKRKILGLCLLLAALVLALLALLVPPRPPVDKEGRQEAAGQTEEAGQEKYLVQLPAGDRVRELSVTKAGDFVSYKIEKEEDGYLIREFPEGRLDRAGLERAVESLMGTRVTEELGVQTDLEQFGLTQEGTDLTIEGQKEGKLEIRIGSLLPGRTDARYALLGGEVCVAEGFPQELLTGRRAFYDLELISIAPKKDEKGENADELEYLRLEGSHFEDPVRIVRSDRTGSGYLMEAPVYGEAMFAATDAVTQEISVIDSLAYVEASAVVCENADGEERERYGLREPDAVAAYSINQEAHQLSVSSLRDGRRYLMVDEDPNIYQVEEIRVKAWAQADPARLRTSYIWLVDVGHLDGLTVTDGSGSTEYRIEQGGEAEGTLRVFCGDRELDSSSEWLPFYQRLLGMTILHIEQPAVLEADPAYTVVYRYADKDRDPVTVELFRERDEGRYAAFLDGHFAGVLRSDTVEETMELTDGMSEDEEDR